MPYNRWPSLAPATRFWLKVYPRGACWEWRGARNAGGYGKFNLDGQNLLAPRMAFEYAKGFLPDGRRAHIVIDHRCNHPWCVKPSHLVLVTRRENLLRGNGFTAQRARDNTTCVRGHLWAENRYLRPNGTRVCRACTKETRQSHRILRQANKVAWRLFAADRQSRLIVRAD